MLKLEHNRIETIQDNVFSDLTLLNSLNVEHNKIVNISNKAFAGLEGMKTLKFTRVLLINVLYRTLDSKSFISGKGRIETF